MIPERGWLTSCAMDAVNTPRLVMLATFASSDLALARASSDSFRLRNVFGERHQESRHSVRGPGTTETLLRTQTGLTILTAVLLFDLKLLALSVEQLADQRPILFDILLHG